MKNISEYRGLSHREAEDKLMHYGKNILHQHKKKSALALFLSQFADFMVLILIVCTAISASMGEWIEAAVIIAIVILNSILGFIQEFRTERTLEALKNLSAPKARVIREGVQIAIPADRVVPGDTIVLRTGDRIPADSIILNSESIMVDESMLTGESMAVNKDKGSLYSGTLIVAGHATAAVTATGMNTEMGKIAGMIQNVAEEQTPLQKRLEKLGKYIIAGCFAICLSIVVIGILRGESVFFMLVSGISLAVAAVPEGLPAIVTIALAIGVRKMMIRNALVRKLPAVETLGCTNVICADKTGTLTQNKMTVRKIVSMSDILDKPQNEEDHKRIIDICGLCNNFTDPTEIALSKIAKLDELSNFTRLKEMPFDSKRKCMSVVVQDSNGVKYLLTKGAPDVLLKKCSMYQCNADFISLDTGIGRKILLYNNFIANDALRVLAMAWRKISQNEDYSQNNIESNLIFVGMVGLIDPPRPEAAEAVRLCSQAGIRTIMITGDHKITASAIAKELNILKKGEKVVTGEELDRMSDDELAVQAKRISVYARVMPAHKLRIVKTLKKLGNTVAMTGDGVNDAPAIKEADIGIAMGISGTDVTREASSMILLDDNFATIVDAIKGGRVIYSNIRKFIRYMLACNLGEVITMFIGLIAGLPLPLLPLQILWVNLVTDGLPAIALGMDPAENDVMEQQPIKTNSGIFSGGLLGLIIFRGILTGLFTLGAFVVVLFTSCNVGLARTSALVTLVLIQLVHSFECRSDHKSLFEIDIRDNLYLIAACSISLLMVIAVVYIPELQVVFRTSSLNINQLGVIAGFVALGPIVSSFWNYKKNNV